LSYLPVSVTAIDTDPKTIGYAIALNGRNNLRFVVASGETFSPNARFDVVVCSHILEHLANAVPLLKNARELLKDEGMLYVAIPNGFGWFELQNFLPRMLCKTRWGRRLVNRLMGKAKDTLNLDSPHVQFFTAGRMKRLLKVTGWRVVAQVKDEFLGGIVFDRILSRIPSLARWNVRVVDRLPLWMTNGWIFVCRKSF
jgi:SAM-dependent methyltransferase